MIIYTKRGDKGETSMYDDASAQRVRVSKDSLRVESLGAIDELNSFLGIVKAGLDKGWVREVKTIKTIQGNLLTIGSIMAGSKLRFSSTQTKKLEGAIDDLEGALPILKNFIVPGGSITSAEFQYARALARRVERRMVAFSKEEKVKPQILKYLNRLSDYLFMLARESDAKLGIKDEIWVGQKR